MSRNNAVCPRCKKNRWQTKIKGQRYVCRNCGYTRDKSEDIK